MLLGFISLLLTVGTKYIAKICIPAKFGDVMLPCKFEKGKVSGGGGSGGDGDGDDPDRRKLLSYIYADRDEIIWRRALAAAAGKEEYCSKYVIKIYVNSYLSELKF